MENPVYRYSGISGLKRKCFTAFIVAPLVLFSGSSVFANELSTQQPLTLNNSIALAVSEDVWLMSNRHKQLSLQNQAEAADSYDDPKVSISLINMPTDSWTLDQEAMSQFKVGIVQTIPRGDSATLKKQGLSLEANRQSTIRQARKAELAMLVSKSWLDYYFVTQKISIIEQNKAIAQQLSSVVEDAYRSAIGGARQQDLLSMQIKLLELDDEKLNAQTELKRIGAQLNRFIGRPSESSLVITDELPNLVLNQALKNDVFGDSGHIGDSQRQVYANKEVYLASLLENHPLVLSSTQQVKVAQSKVELAKQAYKPQWQMNASYGFRENSPSGVERPDFFSIGVTFDLPLFTDSKQDNYVASERSEKNRIKTQKLLLVQNLMSQLTQSWQTLKMLEQRKSIYQTRWLNLTSQQSEASLADYSNDNGNILDVLRSRMTENNTQLAALSIDISRLKTIAEINYFLVGANNGN